MQERKKNRNKFVTCVCSRICGQVSTTMFLLHCFTSFFFSFFFIIHSKSFYSFFFLCCSFCLLVAVNVSSCMSLFSIHTDDKMKSKKLLYLLLTFITHDKFTSVGAPRNNNSRKKKQKKKCSQTTQTSVVGTHTHTLVCVK